MSCVDVCCNGFSNCSGGEGGCECYIVDVTEMQITVEKKIQKIKVFRLNYELHICPTILVVIAIIKSQILPVAV